jgi:hypothetical protein
MIDAAPKLEQLPTFAGAVGLPSVVDLGRHFRVVSQLRDLRDAEEIRSSDPAAKRRARVAHEIAMDESDSIHEMIVSRPIETLAEAAVLAFHCRLVAESCDPATYNAVEMARLRVAISRICLVLVPAAGMQLDDLDLENGVNCVLRDALEVEAHR